MSQSIYMLNIQIDTINLELVKVQQTQIVLLWKFYERECFILYYVRLLQFLQTNLFRIQTSSLLSNAIT